jgi:hypothetical protein
LDLCGALSKPSRISIFQPKIKEGAWRCLIQVEEVATPSSPLPDGTAPKL